MYSIIDIETTGGNPKTDRITEIAVFIHDGKKIVDSWETLVNPECPIPYFITSITGIEDGMVADAPKFYEIAKKLVELTENTVFVAHNVSFDFGFIAQEFKRLGYPFKREKLCTVKLSRKLMPGIGSYGLGNLCKVLNIPNQARHRAAGDARSTVTLFEHLLQRDKQQIIQPVQQNTQIKAPKIPNELIQPLPEKTGVYYFFDEDDTLIYIGKSKNIRSRIIAHFNNGTSAKSVEMQQHIKRIDYEETGSELIALLKESEEIKTELPVYNRAQRRSLFNYGIYATLELDGYIHLKAQRIRRGTQPISTYYSLPEAKTALRKMVDQHELCLGMAGLYSSNGPCFYHQIRRCHGACVGEESPEDYNTRVEEALEPLRYRSDNLIIIDKGRNASERSIVLVKNGIYIGYGYLDRMDQSMDQESILDVIKPKRDNRDIHQIIHLYLRKNEVERLITF
jgi:DNA polymerase-3 subunit epsilon